MSWNELRASRGGSRAAATSKMEHFMVIVNSFQPLTIITKRSILDVAAAQIRLCKSLFISFDIALLESAKLHFFVNELVWQGRKKSQGYFTWQHVERYKQLSKDYHPDEPTIMGKISKQSKEIKQSWTGPKKFDICICVIFDPFY